MSDPRTCSKCNTEKTTDDFYRRTDKRGPGFDCWCKSCRIANSLKYQAEHGVKRKSKYIPKRIMDLNREKEDNFMRYMAENPHYFEYAFHKTATENNIKQAFKRI